ncbi:HAUS augmin-like complex subunit 5 [Agelaius tricolor]|uniref:HAUS augmin-like complex subunit 5 n=1 Tax=Agelaius tricolor TaxID=9191 RepID=UPI0039F17570
MPRASRRPSLQAPPLLHYNSRDAPRRFSRAFSLPSEPPGHDGGGSGALAPGGDGAAALRRPLPGRAPQALLRPHSPRLGLRHPPRPEPAEREEDSRKSALAAPGPPSQQGALRAAVERLRKELQGLGDAIADAQETAQRLEASLEEGQSRRWAELQRGAELRLLGAEPGPAGLRDGREGALRALHKRPSQSRAELSAILASGAEPEVLVSIKALCKAREAELLRPRPHRAVNQAGKAQEAPDWLEQAEAVLIGHSPGAVLWALEALANQSTRALLAGPAPCSEAPPTLRSLLQERWGAVGGVWGSLPPLLSRLRLLRGHLGTLLERGRGDHRGTAR